MKFNWDLIGRIDEESDRKYEIVQAVKDSVPMDEINPPLNDAEKEYKLTSYANEIAWLYFVKINGYYYKSIFKGI